jgi:4'-phosphopantetheinyl transferase
MTTLDCLTPTVARNAPTCFTVWVTHLDAYKENGLLCHYESLLSEAEHRQWRRFLFPRDRDCYLVSHALVRTALSEVAAVHAAELVFEEGRNGKPLLRQAGGMPKVTFNLSHTERMAVLCTAIGCAVGIDVEYLGRPAPLDIAQYYFSPVEVTALNDLDSDRRAERFWSLWTLKEAYLKATGEGLSLPLDSFSFVLNHGGTVEFRAPAARPTEESRWWFVQWAPSPMHIAACCLERSGEAPPSVRFREVVPLQSARDLPVNMLRASMSSGTPHMGVAPGEATDPGRRR